jgi:hypothetical protein
MQENPTIANETVADRGSQFDWKAPAVVAIVALGAVATMAWLGALAFGGYSVAMWFFE